MILSCILFVIFELISLLWNRKRKKEIKEDLQLEVVVSYKLELSSWVFGMVVV